jgi:hypothetical protein
MQAIDVPDTFRAQDLPICGAREVTGEKFGPRRVFFRVLTDMALAIL